jgi:tetratricopeptide (TPR) repeat protein
MTRRDWVLVALIVCELAAGSVFYALRRARPVPPAADLSGIDPLGAAEVRDLVENCRAAEDWARLGEAYTVYGFFPEAEACYRQAAEIEPTAPRAFAAAFALERLGRTGEANTEYERAIERGHPRPADCRYFIGRNLLRDQKPDEAHAAFEEAGNHASSRYERARLLVRAGKFREAAALLDALAAKYPRAIQPHLLRYRIEVLQGNEEAAAAVHADRAERAGERDRLPTPFDQEWNRIEQAYRDRGQLREWHACDELINAGKLAEAEPRLRQALAARWEPAGFELLADIETQRGRPSEAVRLLQGVLERDGPSFHFLSLLGHALDDAGRANEALEAWARALHLRSGRETKDLQYQVATKYEKRGDRTAARRHMAQAYLAAGVEALQNDNLTDAIDTLQQAVQREPTLVQAWYYLGQTRRRLGQADAARQAYGRCLAIDPDHGRARAGLALLGK